ncbi:hypothetical protein GCM10011369_30260 [Neiella marina]|uniref:Uncharacterized protein n=1 Tax=Neiella marina TaxID=508461 RepID=A0A8J2U889_9GAMM|nr:hypothetical protein [Neiella marina]GGA86154.1 hypothetical protein GCM10011369_30260 [Neiella marina]
MSIGIMFGQFAGCFSAVRRRAMVAALIVAGGAVPACQWPTTEQFDVVVNHPGMKPGESKLRQLNRQQSWSGEVRFFVDVNSVFCGEGICRVDPVRLYWNELGQYLGYELSRGVALEKAEGIDFDAADYDKLDAILAFADSDLKHLTPEKLLSRPRGDSGADAFSGASVLVNENHVVSGAIWTSYTLWHWVHSDLVAAIRNHTADYLGADKVVDLVRAGNRQQQLFAIEQLLRLSRFDGQAQQAVLALSPSATGVLAEHVMMFAEQLAGQDYWQFVQRLFQRANDDIVSQLLSTLLAARRVVPANVVDQLSEQLAVTDNLQHIYLLLDVIQRQPSAQSMSAVAALINHPNFIVSRRAYWSLADSEFAADYQTELEHFRNQYTDRL